MTEKRFTLSQNGTLHTVRDNIENKPLGVFEFKDDEFPAYACFHMIIDLMNDLSDENEELKFENKNLKVTIQARDALIEVCEKKFRELGYIITVDDDGYVIE